ncbi:MAG: T9SS type A sorting domain-containing protein [Bacteroidetes bacterium]|nr:T9SS type A sorting domain-containing protein [Bacteroidota bacterium]
MRTFSLTISLLLAALFLSFGFQGDKSDKLLVNNVVIQFEGTNANGNNLWLDNFSFGTRYPNDLTVRTMSLKDKNYFMPGVSSASITPVVTVLNAGRNLSSDATITLTDQASYTSTKNVGSVSGGATINVSFDPLTFNVNTTKNLKAYINWAADQNHNNDTLTQATVFLAGVQKKILFEAHTATTCGPCASQNPYLDAFIQNHFDSIVPIKYHVWWPALGDPMYNADIPQQRVRTLYNSVSAVPTLQIDGVMQQISNYSTESNLLNPFNTRRAMGSPIALSVTDTRLTGDTIKATVTINVVSALPSNIDYRLRICAVERTIIYQTAPGSNGETTFHDVFRWMYPNSDGISINYTPGTYTVEYKYKRDAAWQDTALYTAVFIQDEYTHEIINAAKSRVTYFDDVKLPPVTDNSVPSASFVYEGNNVQSAENGFAVENMEGTFPPVGWKLINNDFNFTFWQYIYAAIGGPSFPGSRAIRISYYTYAENIGSTDVIKSKVYNNVSPSDTISFDWAYANRPGYSDRLTVKISTDGGTSFPFTIFDRSGATLATAGSSTSSFVPTSGQWGTFSICFMNATSAGNQGELIANEYSLRQNYPNPFNPVTNIEFNLPKSEYVTLKVFDVSGREIAKLLGEKMGSGLHTVSFNAAGLSSGVYFYKIEAGNFVSVKKMILLK